VTAAHWDQVYATRGVDEVSWFQRDPAMSLRLVRTAVPERSGAIVDVGAGASLLVDHLLDDGYRDVTLVDVSEQALATVRTRLGDRAGSVDFVCTDVTAWTPPREYDVWHDRAVFHFLTDEDARSAYVSRAATAVRRQGALIIATFAADGPTHCSGLPVRRHSADDLRHEFDGAFVLEDTCREEHVTPAGVVQPFTWAVLRRGDTASAN
jgi:2-polyprenyl-3-methyl-5-hydroxy-6-metoxy-1,4-benzoquinol methylase